MRGLKYSASLSYALGELVALYTSAWIEIPQLVKSVGILGVALYTSAWIEIQKKNKEC